MYQITETKEWHWWRCVQTFHFGPQRRRLLHILPLKCTLTHLRQCDICVRLSWEINCFAVWMWSHKSERDDGDGVSGLSAEVSARQEQLGLFMCDYTQNPSGRNQPDWLWGSSVKISTAMWSFTAWFLNVTTKWTWLIFLCMTVPWIHVLDHKL